MRYLPSVKWDDKVHAYFEHAFGAAKFKHICQTLCKPSLRTCIRVNTQRETPEGVMQELQQLLPASQPYMHPVVNSAVILPGKGPLQPDYSLCGGREVVINRLAGESVLKGAQVYAPGLLAASPGIVAGDLVAVTVALEQKPGGWPGVNRGAILTPDLQDKLLGRQQLAVGLGRVVTGRVGLFRQQQGLAVELVQRVFDVQPCNGVLRGRAMLQALPCIVAAQALDPEPGSRVLDMCAGPGGKTTMLAQIMSDSGQVIALDRTQAKVQDVRQLAADMGLKSVTALVADATQLYQQHRLQAQQSDHCKGQQQQQHHHHMLIAAAASTSRLQHKQQLSGPQHDRESRFQREHRKGALAIGTAVTHLDHTSAAAPASSSNEQDNLVSKASLPSEAAALLQPASFDYVLLDAPCSALGLRPRLLMDWKLPTLQMLAAYQRALLHSAVHVLKPGGHLIYCTCTINPGENEENVRYVLDKWPQMRLVEQPLKLAGSGLVDPERWLTPAEAALVQRFDPCDPEDTIGFFIAKFVKLKPTVKS